MNGLGVSLQAQAQIQIVHDAIAIGRNTGILRVEGHISHLRKIRQIANRHLLIAPVSTVSQIVFLGKASQLLCGIGGHRRPDGIVELVGGGVRMLTAQECVIGPLFQDRPLAKVAVEGQERNTQIGRAVAQQLHKPLHVGAIGEPLIDIRPVSIRQGHRHCDIGRCVGRYRNLTILGIADHLGIQLPGMAGYQIRYLILFDLPTLGHLAQDGGIQGVGLLGIREVHHLEGHGIGTSAIRIIPQLQLGFVGVFHLNISLRSNGCRRIG